MKIVAAYLLATLGGNNSPSAADIKKILDSVGASADDGQISKLLGELEGKDIHQVIEEGKTKLASVPVGGGGAAVAAGGDSGAAEEAAEEKKEETEDESDEDMGMDLFG